MEQENVVNAKIAKAISEINVDKNKHDTFKTRLEKVKNGTWRESVQARKYYGITKFDKLARKLQVILKMPEEKYKDLMFSHKHGEDNDVKTLKIVFETGAMSVRYVFFAMHKYECGQKTDLILAFYTLHSAPRKQCLVQQKETSFFGIVSFSYPHMSEVETKDKEFQSLKADKNRDDYFRYKVVEYFASEGLVDRSKLKNLQPIVSHHKDIMLIRPKASDGQHYNPSFRRMQNAICSIECNLKSVERFQAKVEKFKAQKWQEDVQIRKHFGITNFENFINDIKDVLRLPDEDQLDMICNYRHVRRGEVNKVEVKYEDRHLSTRYVFYAIYKHADSEKTDFVYAKYSLESAAMKSEVLAEAHTRFLWGLFTKTRQVTLTRMEDLEQFEELKADPDKDSYFRKRVLNEFIANNIIERF